MIISFHAFNIPAVGSLAEGVAETAAEPINWLGAEGQLILSTYLLTIVTFLGLAIEIYKLTKIEHELQLISKLLSVIAGLRHPIARRKVRKIARKAHKTILPVPESLRVRAEVVRDDKPLVRSNEGHF